MNRALLIEINWAHGPATRHLVLEEQLDPPSWDTWLSNHIAAPRPRWVALGDDLAFHTQTVQSIELINEVTHEED